MEKNVADVLKGAKMGIILILVMNWTSFIVKLVTRLFGLKKAKLISIQQKIIEGDVQRMKWKPAGYLSANKDKKIVVIMVKTSELKNYYIADLEEALEVLTGRRSWTKILKKWG